MLQRNLPFGSVAVYAENWPRDEQAASTGLDRALVPIITALAPLKPRLVLAPRRFQSSIGKLHPTVHRLAHYAPLPLRVIDEILRRLHGREVKRSTAGIYLEAYLRSTKCKVLLSILGGNPEAYIRAGRLAKSASLPHVIYAVDDPFEWESPSGDIAATDAQVLSDLTQVFQTALVHSAITPALARRFSERLGRHCSDLPLPYSDNMVLPGGLKNQIIYVGNLNYLYSEGFREVVHALGILRSRGHGVVMRATVPHADVGRVLGDVPDWVICGRIEDREEYLTEIADSLMAVCPISSNLPELATTSFPSKLVDYLAQARCIVVHGPAESVAVKYFKDNGLEFTTTNRAELVETLTMIATTRQQPTAAYRSILAENHSPASFREKVESMLAQCMLT